METLCSDVLSGMSERIRPTENPCKGSRTPKTEKQKDKYRDAELLLMQERLKLLEEENELLRKRVQREREQESKPKTRQSSFSNQIRKKVIA